MENICIIFLFFYISIIFISLPNYFPFEYFLLNPYTSNDNFLFFFFFSLKIHDIPCCPIKNLLSFYTFLSFFLHDTTFLSKLNTSSFNQISTLYSFIPPSISFLYIVKNDKDSILNEKELPNLKSQNLLPFFRALKSLPIPQILYNRTTLKLLRFTPTISFLPSSSTKKREPQ